MNIEKTIKLYLKALEIGNLKEMMKLFAEDAIVFSPLYGKIKASDFYRKLFKDTAKSEITLLHIFKSDESDIGAGHFRYDWTLADGTSVSFECVDVFKFSGDNLINELTIIYDTSAAKPAFEKMKS